MSIRIKVSYEHEHELRDVLDHLQPIGITVKRAPEAGRYKRAYITTRPLRLDALGLADPNKRLTNWPECGKIASVE